MTITVYGIKNCNSMKKAFDKLGALGVAYEFFDYKKQVLSAADFAKFVEIFGAEVVNKKGTTFRKFDDDTKAQINELLQALNTENVANLYNIVRENQSLLKRPIVVGEQADQAVALIGFEETAFEAAFG